VKCEHGLIRNGDQSMPAFHQYFTKISQHRNVCLLLFLSFQDILKEEKLILLLIGLLSRFSTSFFLILDAQLHSQAERRTQRGVSTMSSGKLFQLSGIALLLGSVLIILFSLLGFFTDFGSSSSSSMIMFLGSILVLMGFSAVLLHQSQQVGWLGLIGFILTFLAVLILRIGGSGIFPGFTPFYIIGFALGAIMLGWATMNAGVFSRWAGICLMVGGVLSLAPFVSLPAFVSMIGTIIFFMGIGWMGYHLSFPGGAFSRQAQPAS